MTRLFTLILVSVMTVATATADDHPKAGDFALFVTDPFNSNQIGGLNVSTTSFNVGGFVLDDLMVYGGLRGMRVDGDNTFGLNAGARFYLDVFDSPIRTFVDANLSAAKAEVDLIEDIRIVTLGAYVGAEFFIVPRASLAVRVGMTVSDIDDDNDMFDTTIYNMGATDVVLNVYF